MPNEKIAACKRKERCIPPRRISFRPSSGTMRKRYTSLPRNQNCRSIRSFQIHGMVPNGPALPRFFRDGVGLATRCDPLERQSQSKLNLPGSGGGAEIMSRLIVKPAGTREDHRTASPGRAETGLIQHVEHFGPKLQASAVSQGEFFLQGHIGGEYRGADYGVPPDVSERSRFRNAEGARIKKDVLVSDGLSGWHRQSARDRIIAADRYALRRVVALARAQVGAGRGKQIAGAADADFGGGDGPCADTDNSP